MIHTSSLSETSKLRQRFRQRASPKKWDKICKAWQNSGTKIDWFQEICNESLKTLTTFAQKVKFVDFSQMIQFSSSCKKLLLCLLWFISYKRKFNFLLLYWCRIKYFLLFTICSKQSKKTSALLLFQGFFCSQSNR